jgi:hypothetical protein
MPKDAPSAALLRAMEESHPIAPSQDKLDKIRDVAVATRELEALVVEAEQKLTDLKSRRDDLTKRILPDLLIEAGMPEMVLEARGNFPKMRLKIVTVYRAGIAKRWDAAKKAVAFRWLDDHGHGDLIKTSVSVDFPRERRQAALELAHDLHEQYGQDAAVEEAVNSNTLSTWLKEVSQDGQETPPLDVIGGFIYREVKLDKID